MKCYAVVTLLLLASGVAFATKWSPAEKTDPISGEKVIVHEIMSYGSYIYRWPSKYDLIFWPLTDEYWIWFSPKSGYASFGSDFEKLSDEDKKHLAKWLKENYNPDKKPQTHKEKLAWLELIYAEREMNDDFWHRFYRLMAYMHREDQEKSIEYVKKALPLLEKQLQEKVEGIERIEVLYLLGEYNRRLGKADEANWYFQQVKEQRYKDVNGNEKTGHPYFIELINERQQLMK